MQTIIFDVDDTLYDQLQPFRRTVKQHIASSFSEEQILALYKRSREYSDEVFEKHMSGEITALELQTYRIRKACADFFITIDEQQAIAFQQFYVQEQRKIELFPAMKQLLHQLHASPVQLAVLTNGEYDHQMMKVTQLGLTRWIPADHIFVSEQIGYSKPDLEVFQFVEQQLDLERTSTLYIGDSFEHDVIGAKQAGWQVIWLNHRHREAASTQVTADYTLDQVDELFDMLNERMNL
ncbi:HAD family hydrolase [Gracilibacillus alcaliphilus]|uniref:HAD family hydrolase n=1 Tax=Gracilibacillus alcaliphilus TaxID=1401441 RepID=UPI00195CD635|nr:HAD family hydrolase [Gracilibacillus alcaliphilus]MBM7677029.1 putative hydrolase of the HAD superfamily [Gracilibacillus alcaliphilus]